MENEKKLNALSTKGPNTKLLLDKKKSSEDSVNNELTEILDRFGEKVINIKEHFDLVANNNIGTTVIKDCITQEQMIGICLDFGLKSHYLANIVTACDELKEMKMKYAEMDGLESDIDAITDSITFSEFIIMYGTQYFQQMEIEKPKVDDKVER